MVPLHATITEMKATLGAGNVSLATSAGPSYQSRPTVADEHHQQTVGSMQPSEAHEQTSPSGHVNDFNDFTRLNELAEEYLKKGEVERGIQLLEKVVSLQERLPQWDKRLLASKHKLGRAYSTGGRFPEAIEILEDVTKIRGEVLDQKHPDFLASQHELAFAHMQNGQPSEAVKILEYVVATEQAILDKTDMDRLTSQHELARAYLADGRAAEAISLIEHVVEMKKVPLAESHPKLLASQVVLAQAQLVVGRASIAVELLEHVDAVAEASCGEHDEFRAKVWEWLKYARQKALGVGLSLENSTAHSVHGTKSL